MRHLYAGAVVGAVSFGFSLAVLAARQLLLVFLPVDFANFVVGACIAAAALVAVIDYVSER